MAYYRNVKTPYISTYSPVGHNWPNIRKASSFEIEKFWNFWAYTCMIGTLFNEEDKQENNEIPNPRYVHYVQWQVLAPKSTSCIATHKSRIRH